MIYTSEFELSSDPKWVHDRGTALVTVKNASLNMNLDTFNRDGLIQVDFSAVRVQIEDYNVEVSGSTDMSRAIAIILNNFKTFFKQDLSNMLAWRAAKSAEETLNNILFN